MKKLIPLLMTSALSGCSTLDSLDYINQANVNQDLQFVSEPVPKTRAQIFKQEYASRIFDGQRGGHDSGVSNKNNKLNNIKQLNFIARQIIQDLIPNLQYVSERTPMAVSDFVFLDDIDNHSNIVGSQLAESFIHEIHKIGIPVIDYKVTDFIRVTPQGDFVMSRDFLELSGDLPIKYVLTGTLTEHEDGYMVNLRVVGLSTKAVVGSTQGYIPTEIVKALKGKTRNDKTLSLVN